jgi:signal transduction histidine kinase
MTYRSTNLQERALARFVLEQFGEAVIVLDADDVVIDLNRAAHASAFDLPALFATDAACREPLLGLLAELRATGKSAAEITCPLRDRSAGRPLLFEGVSLEGCSVILVRDPSDSRARAAELRELRGLASLGLLTASVAHDLNNLLTPIYALSSLLATRLGSEQRAMADEILSAAERAARLARTVLTTARRTTPEHERIDVNQTARELGPLIERMLGPGIELVLALCETPAFTLSERARLEHAILNLAVNARDAMASGGRLTISTANVALDEPRERGVSEERTYVLISVSDTGAGMSEAVRARLFDRFFTTKDAETGTGLGLASIHNFVSDSGGFVSVDSETGEGTAIGLYLPSAAPGPASSPAPRRDVAGGSETVLVVDGDEAVRRTVSMVLQERGYRVLAADSEDAAGRIAASVRAIDLVLVDTAFPRLGQRALRRRLLGADSDVPCVVMSGRAHGDRSAGWEPGSGTGRPLRKAFSSDELLHEIRSVLDAHRSDARS